MSKIRLLLCHINAIITMNKQARANIAQDTMDIMAAGQYTNQRQQIVNISNDLEYSVTHAVRYHPEDFEKVFRERDAILATPISEHPLIEVTPESTFDAARRLVVTEGLQNVCCLNFASAKNPGGGFLGGAQAQEESLARSSGLYASLVKFQAMYNSNRAFHSCLYTDNMIYSPLVPVFRDEEGNLLDQQYLVSVITSAAVNAGAVRDNEPEYIDHIPAVMFSRMEKLLSVAVAQKQTTLILGAWGCGVFRNDPNGVAKWFAEHLRGDIFSKAFKRVVFAVYDNSPAQATINAFRTQLA
jgi:uncharacterized protein (TIGR02452 family)